MRIYDKEKGNYYRVYLDGEKGELRSGARADCKNEFFNSTLMLEIGTSTNEDSLVVFHAMPARRKFLG
jgi:hypothetical protein